MRRTLSVSTEDVVLVLTIEQARDLLDNVRYPHHTLEHHELEPGIELAIEQTIRGAFGPELERRLTERRIESGPPAFPGRRELGQDRRR